MAETKTLHDAFLDELCDTYDAEKQLVKALPKMAKAATSEELRSCFETHLQETHAQVARLEQVFEILGEKARGKHCAGMAGILEEGKKMMGEDFDEATMDAVLVAGGQRAEHYEMAAYGTLVAWANVLGHTDAAALLEENLTEEHAADDALSALADGGLNAAAAGDDEGGDEDDDDEDDDEEDDEDAEETDDEAPVTAAASAGGGPATAAKATKTTARG